jgi:succinylarginine dihydrolase
VTTHEVNFDGLVGPTHNYAGLAYGNVASLHNKGRRSNPKAAALQGLAKMKLLAELGVKQAVLPPHERPNMPALRRLGFEGGDAQVLQKAAKEAPHLLAACCSASAMWTANAATVSPSADTSDGRVHFTPANLISQFHRSLETETTARVLKTIFADEGFFAHHPPLPSAAAFADEGAANHMRLADGGRGVEVFIYGRRGMANEENTTKRFPARQTLEASQAVARAHGLGEFAMFTQQSPAAIDVGAFHNDVVAVSHRNVLLYHPHGLDADLIRRRAARLGIGLVTIEINAKQISLSDAVKSYLFNSQIVTLRDGSMALIAPQECRRLAATRRFLDWLPSADTPIRKVRYVPLHQSMRNGGGPACLRLRVELTDRELAAAHQGVFLTPALHESLIFWVNRHYRDRLDAADLADPKLMEESRRALDELNRILGV